MLAGREAQRAARGEESPLSTCLPRTFFGSDCLAARCVSQPHLHRIHLPTDELQANDSVLTATTNRVVHPPAPNVEVEGVVAFVPCSVIEHL